MFRYCYVYSLTDDIMDLSVFRTRCARLLEDVRPESRAGQSGYLTDRIRDRYEVARYQYTNFCRLAALCNCEVH